MKNLTEEIRHNFLCSAADKAKVGVRVWNPVWNQFYWGSLDWRVSVLVRRFIISKIRNLT